MICLKHKVRKNVSYDVITGTYHTSVYIFLIFVRVAEVFCYLSSGARGFQRMKLAVGYMHMNILF